MSINSAKKLNQRTCAVCGLTDIESGRPTSPYRKGFLQKLSGLKRPDSTFAHPTCLRLLERMNLRQLIDYIRIEAPSFPDWLTVEWLILSQIHWNPVVDPPIEKYIAEQAGCRLGKDEIGNPMFQRIGA